MLKNILIGIALAMSAGMYIPLFSRILRRKATRDYSKPFSWVVMLVQVNNGMLAVAEHAPYLVCWYVLQTILTAVQLRLVYKFWDTLPPLLRDKQQ